MLPALYDEERLLCGRLALMLCCAALLLAPFVSETSFEARAAGVLPAQDVWTPAVLRPIDEHVVAIARDPFVPNSTSASAQERSAPANMMPSDMVLPPNAGAYGGVPTNEAGDSSAIALRAVVLGPTSRALVEEAGAVRVLAVGDAFAGSVVSAINARGIVLASGTRILLVKEQR